MNDNINPEVNEDLNDAEVTSEELNDSEITEAVDDQEYLTQDANALELDRETFEAEDAAQAVSAQDDDMTVYADEFAAESFQQEVPAEPVKAKKKFPIQIPVIIAACIVLAAILGYLVFVFFFFREPETTTWAAEIDGATYYYEFQDNGVFKGYVGSAELTSTYEKEKSEEGNTLTVASNYGNMYAGYPCTYEVTGSKILNNMELNYSYGEGFDFTLTQAKREPVKLEVSEDFEPEEDLVGSWIFSYMGYDVYKATFDEKGYMTLEFLQQGIKYNGTYTLEDGKINFTYVVSENVTAPGEYSVEGDYLNYMGYKFVREGSDAEVASDDQIAIPAE